jgi:hypothetical protein
MPELLIDFITSLDGYGAADGWPGFWGLEGPEYLGWLGEQPEGDYMVLMGATTYPCLSGTSRRDWIVVATERHPVSTRGTYAESHYRHDHVTRRVCRGPG